MAADQLLCDAVEDDATQVTKLEQGFPKLLEFFLGNLPGVIRIWAKVFDFHKRENKRGFGDLARGFLRAI